MSSHRSVSFMLVASALSLACGARSGLDCFGESCSRPDDDEDGQQGFDPPGGDDPSLNPPGSGGTGSGGSSGSGGRPGRPPSTPDDFPPPDQVPPETPVEVPSSSFCPTGGTFGGSIDVSDEATLQLLRGCTAIDGDLSIFGGGIRDLEPLSRLRLVSGELRITSFPGSLAGLEALESVGALRLQNVGDSTLEALGLLRQARYVEVSKNPNLVSLVGLGNLQVVELVIVEDNPALRTLAGLNVSGQLDTVTIRNNSLLANVDGLASLQLAQALTLEDLPLLSSLAGLINLQAVDALVLVNDPSLTELDLPIGGIGVLHLENVGATTLNGMLGLNRVEKATIQNNPNLVDIDRLGALDTLLELSVLNNPSLVRLPEFGALLNVDQVYVRNNAALATGPSYPVAADAGTITITDNPSLTNLTGFRVLQRARMIDISRNANLIELDLGTLSSARNMRITCNVALPESSLDTLRTSVNGSTEVWGNQGSLTPCAPL